MKKIFIFFTLLFLLVSCGSEKEETQKQKNIEYTFTPTDETSVKLQGKVPLDFVNGEMPSVDYLKKVATQIMEDNPKYENFFINFTFPFVEYHEKASSDTSLYYLASKLKEDSDFDIKPMYSNLEFTKLTFNENMIGHLGINKLSMIAPITVGTSIKDIIARLGTPTKMDDGEHKDNCMYYIVNDNRQMIGILYLYVKDNQVSDISFYSPIIQYSKSELTDIKSYIMGSKKYESLKIKELTDIYN
ncbi:hypothetical protein [Fusobacterium polymorphum]|uniref:hypothetical protein n=1 Tax=Fusobacterium nucleatum subsp. polymorphum TaxID=76857 RepID=UPI0030D21546